jgi:hypothetical protein
MINTTDLLPGNAFRTIAFDHSQVPQCLEASCTKTGTTFCDRSTRGEGLLYEKDAGNGYFEHYRLQRSQRKLQTYPEG